MHNLIVGRSYSGKSQLMKAIIRDNLIGKAPVVVFDPVRTEWPKGCMCYANFTAFKNVLKRTKGAFIVIDEAKTAIDEDPKEFEKWLYQNRHKGQLIFILAQRAKMVPPNARNQCSKVFAFRQTREDAKALVEDFGESMWFCATSEKLNFVYSDGFNSKKGRIEFDDKGPQIRMLNNES